MPFKLFSPLKQLIRSWYAVDRIRIAPTTGRLLQLSAGDSILLKNELYTVLRHKIVNNDGGNRIVFQLASSEGEAVLAVPLDEAKRGEGRLIVNGKSSIVFDSDVVLRTVPVA